MTSHTDGFDKFAAALSTFVADAVEDGLYQIIEEEVAQTYPGKAFVVVKETAKRTTTHFLVDVALAPAAGRPEFTVEEQEGRHRAVGVDGTEIVAFEVEVQES